MRYVALQWFTTFGLLLRKTHLMASSIWASGCCEKIIPLIRARAVDIVYCSAMCRVQCQCYAKRVPRASSHPKSFCLSAASPPFAFVAAVARHLYLRPGVGVGGLTKNYGGAHDRGASK